MDEDQLDDLKQFIDSRLSQSEERIKEELRSEMRLGFTDLRQEMNDGFAGVAEVIEETNTRLDQFMTMTDKRFTKLEQTGANA